MLFSWMQRHEKRYHLILNTYGPTESINNCVLVCYGFLSKLLLVWYRPLADSVSSFLPHDMNGCYSR
jgi:hypothetical protein